MATNFTLTFWLKSLELEQYISTFQEHHITTHQQCLDLDENKLSDIGVNAVGHRRRILNHLPKDFFDTASAKQSAPDPFVAFQNPLNLQPDLPKKEKNPRDLFLFKDNQPLYENDETASQPIYENDADVADHLSKKEPQYTNLEKLNTPKPVPRPVPRPRRTKIKKEDSDGTARPEPMNRPRPAPRSGSSPSPTSAWGPTKTESATKFELEGVCVSESSDRDSFLELYSKPVKNMAKLPSPCLNEEIQGKTPEFETTYISGDESSLNSLDGKVDSNVKNVSIDTKFENAEFDPMSGGYSLKTENSMGVNQSDKNVLSQTFPVPSSEKPDTKESASNSETMEESDLENSDIYEPIWGNKKTNTKDDSVRPKKERNSNLMDFSPFPTNFDFSKSKESPESKRLSVLNKGGNRDSAAFNLPPPEFPPPPLPQAAPLGETVLADFDPLSTPALPPRPNADSKARPFKPYENVPFDLNCESPTMPPRLNEEPDIYEVETLPIRPPERSNVPQNSMGGDIFENIDPFGDFKPTDPDTDFDAEMLGSPFKTPKKKIDTTKSDFAHFPETTTAKEPEAFYEAVDEDFDPFGLKKETVTRKISDVSSGSNKGLNEVVPAPNWAEITTGPGIVDRMYSFAGEIGKCEIREFIYIIGGLWQIF